MENKTYTKKIATAKLFAERFIKRATAYYQNLLKRDSKPGQAQDKELLKLHSRDLADTLLVCYLVKAENFIEAFNIWYNLDTDPRDHFPNGLTDLLEELSETQEKAEKEESSKNKSPKDMHCKICGRKITWFNDIPLKGYCWGTHDNEHKEYKVLVSHKSKDNKKQNRK